MSSEISKSEVPQVIAEVAQSVQKYELVILDDPKYMMYITRNPGMTSVRIIPPTDFESRGE